VLEFLAPCLVKEFNVFRIGPRPASFDVVNPEGVNSLGNAKLVGDREVDAFTLTAVAQSCVVDLDFGFHTALRLTTLSEHPPSGTRLLRYWHAVEKSKSAVPLAFRRR
jgi:hypothetical protein